MHAECLSAGFRVTLIPEFRTAMPNTNGTGHKKRVAVLVVAEVSPICGDLIIACISSDTDLMVDGVI